MYEQMEEIMNEFDFTKVRRTMEALDWTWYFEAEIPSIKMLRECARKHLMELVKHPHYSLSASGGFEAYRDGDRIGLRFIVEHWEAENEENY